MPEPTVFWLLEVDGYDAAATTLRFADVGFNTSPSDTPASQHYNEKIVPGSLRLPVRKMGGQIEPGEVHLANADGKLDHILTYGFDGREARVYRVEAGSAFPGSAKKWVFVVDGQPKGGETNIRLTLAPKPSELETEFQSTRYAGTGGLEGGSALKGKKKPVLLGGPVRHIPAVLVDEQKLIYQVSDGALASLEAFDARFSLGATGWTYQELDVFSNWDSQVGGTWSPQLERWVVVGVGAAWLAGKTPSGWEQVFMPAVGGAAQTWEAVVWGRGLLVAVGSSGAIATSAQGLIWDVQTPDSFTASDDVNDVAYSPTLDLYVAVGDGGIIETSPDGETWTARTSGVSTDLRCVAWSEAEGMFVVGGNSNVILTSTDGASWTSRTSAFASGTDVCEDVTYNDEDGLWGIAGHGFQTSPDGITWTLQTDPPGFTNAIAWTPWGTWAAGDSNGDVYTSDDGGTTWTEDTGAPFGSDAVLFLASNGSALIGGNTAAIIGHLKRGPAKAYANTTDLQDNAKAPAEGSFGYYLAGGYIRLGNKPLGEVTVTATAGATAGDRTHAQLFVQALEKAGKTTGDWSASDITAADSADSSTAGKWYGPDDQSSTGNVLQEIAESFGADWWTNQATGVYRFVRRTDPSGGTANLAIPEGDTEAFDPADQPTPVWRVEMRYDRNYSPERAGISQDVEESDRGDLQAEWKLEAAEDATVKTKHPKARVITIDSLYTGSSGASTEASRRLALLKVLRTTYRAKIEAYGDILDIDLGSIDTWTQDRFGLDSGEKMLVVSAQLQPDPPMLHLDLWD